MALAVPVAAAAAQAYAVYRGGKMLLDSTKAPKAPAIPPAPPAAKPPTYANASVVAAGQKAKGAAAGESTNVTGGQGLVSPPNTSGAKLLG